MSNTNQIVVDVDNLKKRFPGTDALQGVSFQLEVGKIVGLLGPNGSGKSTLLKCIVGLLRPDQGTVTVLGQKPSRHTKAQVAFLPEIDYLYRWMTVKQTLEFFATMYHDWDKERVPDLVAFMKLEPSKKVSELSKGMRARLKLVLTMARDTRLVLLDEPLSGIDPASRGKVVEAIVTQFSTESQTILLSTHEVGETESLFDSVIFLDNGQVKLMDEADNLRKKHGQSMNELFKEVYR